MSTAFAPQSVAPPAFTATTAAAKPVKTWLVGPWFDLLFLANLAWPVAVLLYFLRPVDAQGPDVLSFFQVYFLSTPHRWITLVLVFCDSERFWKEPAKFGGLAAGLVALGLALVGTAAFLPELAALVGVSANALTSSLVLLMMLDYIWNAWHFAAQHAGISRIYGRTTRPEQSLPHAEFEKTALRVLVLWVFFRFAVHMASISEYSGGVEWMVPWLGFIDPFALILPAILLYREAMAFRGQCIGRFCYMASVIALYTAQLLAIRLESGPWMMAFFFAGAVFHAVEYLAICNWSVQKRTTGIWRYQITRTGLALVVFMLLIGGVNYLVNAQSIYAWALITLLVSLLHYAYDGIIWRAKPAPVPAKL
jgi:hypothetical protein